MDWLSPPGLIGALIGFVIGLVDYQLARAILIGRLRQRTAGHGADPIPAWANQLLIAVIVGGFTALGYGFGRSLGG